MIPIRALQHYLYCPHRWAALYLSGEWRENALTVRAGIAHERVHSGKTLDTRGGAKTLSGVTLYSIKLGIYGKADILEVWQSGEKTSVRVVEYKPSKRAVVSTADRLQVYAQFRCAQELFGNAEAFIYYADARQRIKLSFTEEDERLLLQTIDNINECVQNGIYPPPRRFEGCNGCSLADSCMPKVTTVDVKKTLEEVNA